MRVCIHIIHIADRDVFASPTSAAAAAAAAISQKIASATAKAAADARARAGEAGCVKKKKAVKKFSLALSKKATRQKLLPQRSRKGCGGRTSSFFF
jgi:hypothetical protein